MVIKFFIFLHKALNTKDKQVDVQAHRNFFTQIFLSNAKIDTTILLHEHKSRTRLHNTTYIGSTQLLSAIPRKIPTDLARTAQNQGVTSTDMSKK